MSFRKMPRADVREGDNPAMVQAIEYLNAAGVEVRRPHGNAHQLKVSATISYYPSRQSIYIDGETGTRPERGLAALLDLIGANVTHQDQLSS